MTEIEKDAPDIFLKPNGGDKIHEDRLIFSFDDGNIYIPNYHRNEDEFIQDVISINNAWAFTIALPDEYVKTHVREILNTYVKTKVREMFEDCVDKKE